MENKNLLEKVERISVIFAALLGAIAFFWQVAGYVSSKQERANFVLWCYVRPYAAATPQLSLEVVNISDRPIYIKTLEFWVAESPNSSPIGLEPYITPTIGAVYPNLDLIDVGASREYSIQMDTAQLSRFKNVYLAVYSATSEIRRTENLASPLEYLTKRLIEAQQTGMFQTKYQCNQP